MIIAIDIGNTNIVFGGVNADGCVFTERISTDVKKTELEYAVIFRYILELYGLEKKDVEGAIISCVVPQLCLIIEKAMKKVTGVDCLVVGPGVKTGLNILIDDPGSLGADMVATAIGAIKHYQEKFIEPVPIVLFDMGTATTVSVIDEKSRFIGGMILPGPKVAIESLSSSTSQLPHISLELPGRVIGRNTIDCMRSGVIYGYASMTDGIIDRVEEELGRKIFALATGGLSSVILPNCRRDITVDHDLIMKGLYSIYKKNRKQ